VARIVLVLAIGIGLVGMPLTVVAGETFQALALQKATLYGETMEAPTEVKRQFLSRGQEYLREYFREQMIRNMAVRWLVVDPQRIRAGVAVNLDDFYNDIKIPLQAQMRIYADEDLNHYINCGRFLPIEVEMDSSLSLVPNFKLKAKLQAPFDDVMRLQFGSQIDWSQSLHSSIQYQLRNNSQVYDGIILAVGMKILDWRWKLNYEITADWVRSQYISLASDF